MLAVRVMDNLFLCQGQNKCFKNSLNRPIWRPSGSPLKPSFLYLSKEREFKARICIQYLGHHSKSSCQKSAKSMRYHVRPKFESYRKSLLKFCFKMNTILAWKTRLVRGLRFKTKSFNSRAVEGR